MPDQFIHVSFPEKRTVLSGGNPVGPTNEDLVINAGTHTFTLDGPEDYDPPSQRIVVAGTSVVTPLEIVFEQLAPPAALTPTPASPPPPPSTPSLPRAPTLAAPPTLADPPARTSEEPPAGPPPERAACPPPPEP
jgi:hypothetical protein